MSSIARRKLLSASALIPVLGIIGCSSTPGSNSVTFDMMKAYLGDLVGAVSAAAQAYLAATPNSTMATTINLLVVDLQALNATIQGLIPTGSDVKSIALQVLAAVQQLTPLVAPFLGPAGAFVPLAVAVIMAFIQSLPAPPNTPPTPPAALHRMAATYRPQR